MVSSPHDIPMDDTSSNLTAMMTALREVLIADGVLNTDTDPTGPELIMAADEYVKFKSGK